MASKANDEEGGDPQKPLIDQAREAIEATQEYSPDEVFDTVQDRLPEDLNGQFITARAAMTNWKKMQAEVNKRLLKLNEDSAAHIAKMQKTLNWVTAPKVDQYGLLSFCFTTAAFANSMAIFVVAKSEQQDVVVDKYFVGATIGATLGSSALIAY